ncbi:hypothetical protein [Gorillibacterium massiliense]|nr:hypothetical protein [Gorillibacterium massiliense]
MDDYADWFDKPELVREKDVWQLLGADAIIGKTIFRREALRQ